MSTYHFFVLSKISLQLLLQKKQALGIMTSVDLYVSHVYKLIFGGEIHAKH